MKILISNHFQPLLDNEYPELLLYGGRGSGKSEFLGRKIFYRCMKEGNHKFLILRKVARDNDSSTIAVMLSILNENGIEYNYNKTKKEIEFGSNILFFDGMDNWQRLKSKKGITSIWMEELTEFTENDFIEIDLILREPTPYYKQIVMSFNPDEAQAAWIKETFFVDEKPTTGLGKREGSYIHWSNVHHNPIKKVRDEYIQKLGRLKDAVKLKIYLEGVWALARGIIYDWDVQNLPEEELEWFDEIWYGGDFGFSVDPAAVVRIYRKADEYWLQQVIYSTGLTNQALGREMRGKGVSEDDVIYFDSAEPKSIQELYEMGFDVHPAIKGPDSVRAGIDFLKELTIHITPDSTDIISERKGYKWMEDKEGRLLNKPEKFDDHTMDGSRYGIFSHMRDRTDMVVEVLG